MSEDLYGIPYSDLLARCERELVVAVDEDWGWREWIWLPGGTPEELEVRWMLIGHMPDTAPPTFLWGDWIHVGQQPDCSPFSDLWSALWRRRKPEDKLYYAATIDGDGDHTKLITPDDRLLFHMGVDGNPEHKIQYRLEWREKQRDK